MVGYDLIQSEDYSFRRLATLAIAIACWLCHAGEVKKAAPKAAPKVGGAGHGMRMMVAAPAVAARPAVSKAAVQNLVGTIVAEVTGKGAIDEETPLMEAGLDSLAAVELRNRLTAELPDLTLPNTLVFDYPTVAAVAQ